MIEPEPEQWSIILAGHAGEVSALARRLRLSALSALPDLTERVYEGWKGLGLRHPTAGLIATIFARDEDVVVYLERGASLPDPEGLLGGAGRLRQTRTIAFRPDAETPSVEQLVAFLDLAVEHADGR